MRRLRLLLLLAIAGTAGCADSVINVIQPENDRTITVVRATRSPYIVTDLENVTPDRHLHLEQPGRASHRATTSRSCRTGMP